MMTSATRVGQQTNKSKGLYSWKKVGKHNNIFLEMNTLINKARFCNAGINFQFLRRTRQQKLYLNLIWAVTKQPYDICKIFLILTENKLHFQSVTLSDEVAKKRKVQKTILERKGPPTFTCAVEMISKTEYRVHRKLDVTVDNILAGTYNKQITSFSYISRPITVGVNYIFSFYGYSSFCLFLVL